MNSPNLILIAAYWLHMVATVLWIGGLASLSIFVLPAAKETLNDKQLVVFLAGLQRRLDPLAWFSLAVLAGTGLIQMSANQNYQGILRIDNVWSAALLVKHLVFLVMVIISAYITWELLPGLRRSAMRQALLRQEEYSDDEKVDRLEMQQKRLLKTNLLLGLLVLILTAIARAV